MVKQTVSKVTKAVDAPAYVTSRNLGYGRSKKLRVASFGRQRSGKSRLAVTAILATDSKLGLIPLDPNAIPTALDLETEYGLEGMIAYPAQPLFSKRDSVAAMQAQMIATRAAKKAADKRNEVETRAVETVKDVYKGVIERTIEQVLKYAVDDEIGIVCIDTGEQLYRFMQLCDFGKLENNLQRNRGAVNQDMANIISLCEGKHLIITHPTKPEYRKKSAGTNVEAEATGREIMDSWPGMAPSMNVVVEHVKIDDSATREFYTNDMRGVPKDGLKIPAFLMRPFESQHNPKLSRKFYGHCLVNDDCSFEELGAVVYGEVDGENVERNRDWLKED